MTNPTPERPERPIPPRQPLDPIEAAAVNEMREPPQGEPRTAPDNEGRGGFSFRRMEPWQQWTIGGVAVVILLLLFLW